ncbi:MAG: hypothetical protein Q8882_02610 [Bacillota bacterium]|nr:hypothetical protein [Bacillota bacterium]
MIEQHVFVKSHMGLATYKKTAGLSDEYIETYIKPYYTPLDIYYLQEKHSSSYKNCIALSSGGLLIGGGCKGSRGKEVYIHNYVVKREDVDSFVQNAGNMTTSPADKLDLDSELVGLDEIPGSRRRIKIDAALESLGISKQNYFLLLASVFAALEENRKIFICLNQLPKLKEPLDLMCCLYQNLPYALRSSLGYTTFFNDGETQVGIDIYFVPEKFMGKSPDYSLIGSHNSSKDYVFDFNSGKLIRVSELSDDIEGDFFKLAIESLETGKDLKDFFDFARDLSEDLPDTRLVSLRLYDDLAYIFNLEKNADSIMQKAGRITIIFSELLKDNPNNICLESYSDFLKTYRNAIKKKGAPSPLEILKRLAIHYESCPEKQRKELYDLLTLDLDICLKTGVEELVFTHVDTTRAGADLYNTIVELKFVPSPRLINAYFTYLLVQKKTVHAIMEFADSIFSDMPQAAGSEIVQNMLREKTLALFDTSGDVFVALKYLEKKCVDLSAKYPDNQSMFSEIYNYALYSYMTSLNIEDITIDQINMFPLRGADKLEEDCVIKQNIIMAIKEILALTNDTTMAFIHYDAFGFENIQKNLASDPVKAKNAELQLKNKLYDCICLMKDVPCRILYTILYYICENKEGRVKNDFDRMFNFVDKELCIPPFDFISWYLSSNLFMVAVNYENKTVRRAKGARADLTVLTAFYNSMKKYFEAHGDLLASEKNLKKLRKDLDRVSSEHHDFRQLSSEFRRVLGSIISQNYSPFRRLVDKVVNSKNFKFSIIVIILLIAIIGGAIFGTQNASKQSENNQVKLAKSTDGKQVNLDRTYWSSIVKGKNGNYKEADSCIDDNPESEIFNLKSDALLKINFNMDSGLVINGISVSVGKTTVDAKLNFYVITEDNRKLLLGVSDFDITTGSSIYSFSEPMSIKEIVAEPEEGTSGSVEIKEINAFINQ